MHKTKEQLFVEIEQYFHPSRILEFERKIEYYKKLIIDCEEKIGKLLPCIFEKEITVTKSKNEKIKEKIKKVQGQIIYAKKGRVRRKEEKARKKNKREKEKYYTESQIDDIIKSGRIQR